MLAFFIFAVHILLCCHREWGKEGQFFILVYGRKLFITGEQIVGRGYCWIMNTNRFAVFAASLQCTDEGKVASRGGTRSRVSVT